MKVLFLINKQIKFNNIINNNKITATVKNLSVLNYIASVF